MVLWLFTPQKVFAIDWIYDIPGASNMEEQAEVMTQPYALPTKKYDCNPGEDGIECQLRIDSEEVGKRSMPYIIQGTPPERPEEETEPTPEVVEKSVVRTQSIDILGWLRKVIEFFATGWRGHLTALFPAEIIQQREDLSGASNEIEAMKVATGDNIVDSFVRAQEASLPEVLKSGKDDDGLPSELEPEPIPEGGELWYTIDHQDSSLAVGSEKKEEITSLVLKYWPDSKIQDEWEYVYKRARENGWNSAFVIAVWIEESGASGVHAWDVGCTGAPKNNLEKGLDCLFGLSYASKPFPEFLCRFSEGHYPCVFSINPNFPKNLKAWYDRIVPIGTDGAAKPL